LAKFKPDPFFPVVKQPSPIIRTPPKILLDLSDLLNPTLTSICPSIFWLLQGWPKHP
jgi:hypothetical protein